MKRNSTAGMGALHPILFFMFVYGISLFLAFFVCHTVYNSLNEEDLADRPVNSKMPLNATAMNSTVHN